MKEVNILGTTYYLEIDETDLLKNINADGLHKEYAKKIIVRKLNDFLDDSDSEQEKRERAKEVVV